MDTQALQSAAQTVARHRLEHTALSTLPQLATVEDGYRAQDEGHRLLAPTLGAVVGHKIGATNAAIQQKLGVGHPCAGGVYAKCVWPSGTRLSMSQFVRPGLECEIAFRLGHDMASQSALYARQDVVDAIDACMISMEIVDNRHANLAQIHIPTLLADDTLDAGVLLGAALTQWRSFDFPILTGIIHRNGAEISRGQASNVLGDPVNAMVWIANTYSGLGRTLRRGEFVSTGSIADLIWAQAGEHYKIEVPGVGSLEVSFV